jgi:hypothetical protein
MAEKKMAINRHGQIHGWPKTGMAEKEMARKKDGQKKDGRKKMATFPILTESSFPHQLYFQID